MNYITSCPKCDTHFLISTEHLKAGHGKVQCGNCEHIFNAKNRLKEASENADAVVDAVEEETTEITNEEVAAEQEVATQTVISENESNENPTVESIVIEAPIEAPASPATSSPFFLEDLTADPKFNQTKPKNRYGLAALAVFLALVAGFQYVYFSRTELAAQYPQYKPLLSQACDLLHCKIALPQHLELLVIDDSDMQEDQNYQDVINFSGTLINHANFAQAFPDIELTLTNADDHPVLRKIIKPVDYLGALGDLESGLGPHDEIRIKLPIHTTDVQVSGYRVQPVY